MDYQQQSFREKEKLFMTKVQHPDHFRDFVNKTTTISHAQDESKPKLLSFVNNIVPISPRKAQQSREKGENFDSLTKEGALKSNCSVDSLFSLSKNRSDFSEIFLDKPKKKVKCNNLEKMGKKRLIRDILKKSKTSLNDGEKRNENEIDHSQSRSRKKDSKREGPPYRPTIVRTEDLFPDKTKKSEKAKSAKILSKKALKVMAQITQGKGDKPEDLHENEATQDKVASSPIYEPISVKAQNGESPLKVSSVPSTEKESNSEATLHQTLEYKPKNEDLFSLYLNTNKEPKIEYINIDEEKEKENAELNQKLQQLENREKMLEERERKIRLEQEMLERRLKEEQELNKEFRKIFTIKRKDPSLLKDSEQHAFKAKCKQLLMTMKNRYPQKKKTLDNNTLITSKPKHQVKQITNKKDTSTQPQISSQTMRQEAISRRLSELQAMLQKHEQQLKKWCY